MTTLEPHQEAHMLRNFPTPDAVKLKIEGADSARKLAEQELAAIELQMLQASEALAPLLKAKEEAEKAYNKQFADITLLSSRQELQAKRKNQAIREKREAELELARVLNGRDKVYMPGKGLGTMQGGTFVALTSKDIIEPGTIYVQPAIEWN